MHLLQMNRSVVDYRKAVELASVSDSEQETTRDLALSLLAMLEDPGTYTIIDGGGWVKVTRWDENQEGVLG